MLLIFLIIVSCVPFVVGFINIWSTFLKEFYDSYLIIPRTNKMLLLIFISALFVAIDFIMLKKANTDKINYATNLYQSDFPVLIGFIVLGVYAFYLGDQAIESNKLNHFFEGAIAFQMIFSNIIWMYNDDEFWKSNT